MSASTPLSFDHRVIRWVLPHRFNMLLLDRVEAYIQEQRAIVGVKHIGQNEPLAQGYLPFHPFFPPTLVIETLAQICGFMMNLEYLAERGFQIQSLQRQPQTNLPSIPHSVLAESRMRHKAVARLGQSLLLKANIVLQRNEIYVFKTMAHVEDQEISVGEIMLAYPEYTTS
jgi:3-hydroxyacyl-[acyl-carrier-protein] dehydratase